MSSPYRGLMLTTVFVGTLRICCSLTFVWVCKRLIDIVTGESSAPLYASVVILCCVMLGQIGCGIAYSYIQNLNSMKCRNRLREDFFSHVLSSGWKGKEEFHTGDTVNRLEEDIRVVSEFLCVTFPSCLVTLVQLIAACVVGDGEAQEGEIWEAANTAHKYKLDNLVVFVDYNNLQIDGTCDEVMPNIDLGVKFKPWAARPTALRATSATRPPWML